MLPRRSVRTCIHLRSYGNYLFLIQASDFPFDQHTGEDERG